MKAFKFILNFFGILLAIILSIITLGTLIITPIISSVSSFLQTDTLHKMISDINLSDMFESHITEAAPDSWDDLDVEFIDEFMSSELVKDIIDLYLNNLLGLVEQDRIDSINQEQIDMLLNKHMPEMISIIRPQIPAELPVTDAEITQYATSALTPILVELVALLPTLEDLGLDSTTISILHMLHNGTLLRYTIYAVLILSLLIVLCRFPRFKGFGWLSVAYLLATLILFLLGQNAQNIISALLSEEFLEKTEFLLQPLLNLFRSNFLLVARNTLIVAVACLLVFILGRKLSSLRKPSVQDMAA
ncbi:MAG: hypothetical protein J6L65_01285 [Lachnospiraceae bacterium]|nr:hypothetical protein [Lachnospiraceae bacterium]